MQIRFFSSSPYLIPILTLFLFLCISCGSDDNVFVIPSENDVYHVHFIDVGQGDAIFVSTPVKNLLVDGGVRNSGVVEYLKSLDVESIDYVIGTHPHADHIGGLIGIFHEFEIGEVFDPGVVHTTNTFHEYLATIDLYDIPFTIGRKGMERELSPNAYFELLHPVSPSSNHLNNASIVARVHLGNIRILLTGDLEKEGEADVLKDPDLLQSHILKVGHHGSNTSSTMPFLLAVNPRVSVIQCGEDNPYGHPHQPVLERLAAIETQVYRNDLHGHVIIETDGVNYEVILKNN
ncbi:MAG: MBL fold metallo-hydrolase [Bacteroidia bacterium]|nr:MAG: MBL fold metallo-hydrolase [Bacteroidia bacterium]